jgi:putative heme iron utilization protein
MQTEKEFDAGSTTKRLLREARIGSLATLMAKTGDPYCSLVNVATAADGSPLLLISRLALHTQNIEADARVSLLLAEQSGADPLQSARVMLMGVAAITRVEAEKRRFLVRHPAAVGYAGFKDFGFYRVALKGAHLVAGFGRIEDLSASEVLTDVEAAQSLVEAEPEICAHMNEDHADAVRLYATRLLGAPDADWRCVGCDPEGLDLQAGQRVLRLPFPTIVRTPGVLRQTLKLLADRARESGAPD